MPEADRAAQSLISRKLCSHRQCGFGKRKPFRSTDDCPTGLCNERIKESKQALANGDKGGHFIWKWTKIYGFISPKSSMHYTLHYWAGERQWNSGLNTTSILINCAHQNILYIQYRRIGIMRTFCFGSINKLILYPPARVYKESDTAVYLYQINTNW